MDPVASVVTPVGELMACRESRLWSPEVGVDRVVWELSSKLSVEVGIEVVHVGTSGRRAVTGISHILTVIDVRRSSCDMH